MVFVALRSCWFHSSALRILVLPSNLDVFPLFSYRKMMDKQTFSSIQATTNTSRYAAAVFHKGLILFFKTSLFPSSSNLVSLLVNTHLCASRVRVSSTYVTFQNPFMSLRF